MEAVVTIKRCPRCGEEKPLDEFHAQRKGKHGKQSYCKTCKWDVFNEAARQEKAQLKDVVLKTDNSTTELSLKRRALAVAKMAANGGDILAKIDSARPKIQTAKSDVVSLADQKSFIRDLASRTHSCVYCGDYYQCRDHVIPVCWTGLPRRYSPGDVVPSCNECNMFLGDKPIFNIRDRAAFLISRYEQKRLKFLRFPKWSSSEISELGYGVRVSIEQKNYLRKVYEAKLANLQLVANGCEPIPL